MNKKAKVGLISAFILVGILLVTVALATPANKGNKKDSCSDTDGGIVPNTVGTTSGYYNRLLYSHADFCTDAATVKEYYCSGAYEQSIQQGCGTDSSFDSCQGGNVYTNSTDYFCSSGACGVSNTATIKQVCSYGCTGGACNPAPADSCADTDGGSIPTVNGTTYGYLGGSFYSYTDACSSSTVVLENYCGGSGGNYRSQSAYSCGGNSTNATTCIIGACV